LDRPHPRLEHPTLSRPNGPLPVRHPKKFRPFGLPIYQTEEPWLRRNSSPSVESRSESPAWVHPGPALASTAKAKRLRQRGTQEKGLMDTAKASVGNPPSPPKQSAQS